MNPWKLYDDLIGGIPADITVTSCVAGYNWTYVSSSEGNTGTAKSIPAFNLAFTINGAITGMSLRALAELSKSWNYVEASLGVAAMNAYYNHPSRAFKCGIPHPELDRSKANAFDLYKDETAGKKVTIVGHFPNLEKHFDKSCKLTILEREPQQGDLPDPACEYILCEQDYVFITGCTLVNKTLPRLLELSKNARTIIVGPSAVLSHVMFEYGVHGISGMVFTSCEKCETVIKEGNPQAIFSAGERVDLIAAAPVSL